MQDWRDNIRRPYISSTIPIIISSFGRREELVCTLCSLLENSGHRAGYRIIVVDNASSPSTRHILHGFEDDIDDLVFLSRNSGKPHAWNIGLMLALQSCDFHNDQKPGLIVFADSDVKFLPRWLNTMQKVYMTFKDDKLGVLGGYLNEQGHHKTKIARSGEYEIQIRRHPPGCCWMISTDVIRAVGLFDSKELIRGVDTSYNMRVWKAGYNNACVFPNSIVRHIGGEKRTWDLQTGEPRKFP